MKAVKRAADCENSASTTLLVPVRLGLRGISQTAKRRFKSSRSRNLSASAHRRVAPISPSPSDEPRLARIQPTNFRTAARTKINRAADCKNSASLTLLVPARLDLREFSQTAKRRLRAAVRTIQIASSPRRVPLTPPPPDGPASLPFSE